MTYTLKYPDTLTIEYPDKTEYGCNQERYRSFWRRMAGCGPSVTATICGYNKWRGKPQVAETWLDLMDDIWEDVTPTMQGLPSVRHLTDRIDKYLLRAAPDYITNSLDVPGINDIRPDYDQFTGFISQSLLRDIPVALLTLDVGKAENLDDWHWTIIVSLDLTEDSAKIVNYNCGYKFEVDLKKWFETTNKGGGLVTLTSPPHIS